MYWNDYINPYNRSVFYMVLLLFLSNKEMNGAADALEQADEEIAKAFRG